MPGEQGRCGSCGKDLHDLVPVERVSDAPSDSLGILSARHGARPHRGAMTGRQVVVVGFDGIELVDVACVTTGFDYANRMGAEPAYQVLFATPLGRPVRCDSGLEPRGQGRLDGIDGRIDTLVVSGGQGHEAAAANPRLVGQVRRLAELSRRIASVCTGATVLAAAGLLDGRRATTHWYEADRLAELYPRVRPRARLRPRRLRRDVGRRHSLPRPHTRLR